MEMNELFLCLVAFLSGGCFVSCGNCVRYRVARGLDWVHDRSVCEGCGKPLTFWELIPVFSCLVLRGRCKKCGHFFGYAHAESEAYGGVFCSLLYLMLPDIHGFLPAAVFGLLYITLCWVEGKLSLKNK